MNELDAEGRRTGFPTGLPKTVACGTHRVEVRPSAGFVDQFVR